MPLTLSGDGSIGPLNATEVGYLEGVTSSVQTQLNAKPDGGVSSWQSWTPSWTNFTLGNGSVISRYSQIGKIVFISITITWGSTTSATASSMAISLPISANTNGSNIGFGFLRDSSAAIGYLGTMELNSSTTAIFGHNQSGSNSTVTATAPFTWAVGDTMKMNGFYEAA